MSWITDSFQSGQFAQVPKEALLDKRFKPRHLAVYCALCLHAEASTGKIKMLTNDRICELAGVADSSGVAVATRDLAAWGYIEKHQTHFNGPNTYQLKCPDYQGDELRSAKGRIVPSAEFQEKVKAAKAAGIEQAMKKQYVVPQGDTDGSDLVLTHQELLVEYEDYKTGHPHQVPVEYFHRWGLLKTLPRRSQLDD